MVDLTPQTQVKRQLRCALQCCDRPTIVVTSFLHCKLNEIKGSNSLMIVSGLEVILSVAVPVLSPRAPPETTDQMSASGSSSSGAGGGRSNAAPKQPLKAKKKRAASASAANRSNPKRLRVAPEPNAAAAFTVSRAPITGGQRGMGLLSADTALQVVGFLSDSPKSCANWFASNRVIYLCAPALVWCL